MRYAFFSLFILLFIACGGTPDAPVKDLKIVKKEALSILGNRDVDANGDTIYPTIPDARA